MRNLLLFSLFLLFISCAEDYLPKPKAYLNLDLGKNKYEKLSIERPYVFDVSKKSIAKGQQDNWMKIEYPTLNASIDITYRPVNNNLKELLIESEKLVFKHTSMAERISSNDFIDEDRRVFGSVYEITGNAASQIQFHVTDSTDHFIKGALYFYTKPNYDSILPAVFYVKKDIARIMETLEWK